MLQHINFPAFIISFSLSGQSDEDHSDKLLYKLSQINCISSPASRISKRSGTDRFCSRALGTCMPRFRLVTQKYLSSKSYAFYPVKLLQETFLLRYHKHRRRRHSLRLICLLAGIMFTVTSSIFALSGRFPRIQIQPQAYLHSGLSVPSIESFHRIYP